MKTGQLPSNSNRVNPEQDRQPVERRRRAELESKMPCCGRALWALNERHLAFPSEFVSARAARTSRESKREPREPPPHLANSRKASNVRPRGARRARASCCVAVVGLICPTRSLAMYERHENEQYFFDSGTLDHLSAFARQWGLALLALRPSPREAPRRGGREGLDSGYR